MRPKEWLAALKKGSALRFVDAVEPPGEAFDGHEARGILATSADGAWVLVRSSSDARLCDAELGRWRVIAKGPRWAVGGCFAGELAVVAWKGEGRVVAVDLNGKKAWSAKAEAELGEVHRLCVNTDEEIVVAHERACVRWLDAKTGRELRRLALGRRSGTLRRFNEDTGEADGPEYRDVFHEVVAGFDASGRYALSWFPKVWNQAHHPGDLRLWDFASSSCTEIMANAGRPLTMVVAPGARWAIEWGGWAAIELWDLVEKKMIGLRPPKEGAMSTTWGPQAALSPDGRHWVSAVDREICLWETSAESPIDRIEMPSYPSIDGPLAFSPDGTRLYLCFEGHVVRMAVDPTAA